MSKARDLANAGTALGTVDATELGYLDGVTSAVQTQINSKIGSASAINPTIVDAKGDIIAATAADTVDRLAVGANDTVLTADSSAATGLKWATPAAGSLTQLATGTLSGAQTDISSISGSYKNLILRITGSYATGGAVGHLRFNNLTTSIYSKSGTSQGVAEGNTNVSSIQSLINSYGNTTANNGTETFEISNYTNTIKKIGTYFIGNGANECKEGSFAASITSAITQINLVSNGGTWSGGTYTLFGVN
jgi:hypothetical protein